MSDDEGQKKESASGVPNNKYVLKIVIGTGQLVLIFPVIVFNRTKKSRKNFSK